MDIFLVGGAVRDELLGLPVKDRDWVVTGATPEQMADQGFRPVGQDFPVFLHPKTHEEYALARTERKSGHGYSGFVFHTSPNITLEEDLLRRDLTINAIAKDDNGKLVDPYNGQQDLENKILRHVSPAFREDPLRILRVARFAARFAQQGFTIAPETLILMQDMVAEGEAAWLVAERVWQETHRALESDTPALYFQALSQCHALKVVMPEVDELFQTTDSPSAQALNLSAQEQQSAIVRFATAICTANNTQNVKALCKRMKVPTLFKEVAEITSKVLPEWLTSEPVTPANRLKLLQTMDGFRRQERFESILEAARIFSTIDKQQSKQAQPELSETLKQDLESCKEVDVQALIKQGFKGKELAEEINNTRLKNIEARTET